jgi:hypothetical protein
MSNAKCLICGNAKQEVGEACKLCGMHALNPLYYRSFPFCCNECIAHFENIISNTSPNMVNEILVRMPVV